MGKKPEPQVTAPLLFFLACMAALTGLTLAYALVRVLKHLGAFKEHSSHD